MGRKAEYDFLTWTSFPSSLKIVNDDLERGLVGFTTPTLPVTPGTFRIEVQVKQENVTPVAPPHVGRSAVFCIWYDGEKWHPWEVAFEKREIPGGTFNWTKFKLYETSVSPEMIAIKARCIGGGGSPEGVEVAGLPKASRGSTISKYSITTN